MAKFKSSSDLIGKLRSVYRRQRLVLFIGGLLVTVAVVVSIAVLLSLVANVVVLPVWFKTSVLALAGIAALYVFGRYALGRLFGGKVEDVARQLEEHYPELKGRLIAAVQFAGTRPHVGFSQDLIALTEQQALSEAGDINFSEVITFHSVWRNGKLFLGSIVLAVGLLILFPGLFSYSYEVFSNVTTEVAPPLAYDVVAVPGSTEWVKYRDIKIGGAVIGLRLPERAYIHHRLAGGNWQKTRVDLEAVMKVATEHGDSAGFAITLRQISRSFDFYVEAGRLKTEIQSINVVDRPRVTAIKLAVFYPEYTGLEPLTIDENNGSFSAVIGSRVNMKITANLPVTSAALVYEDSSSVPLAVEGRTGSVSLRIDRSQSYYVRLLDHLGELNPDPIEYYITAVPDEYPSVEVVRPGFDVNLGDEMILPLKGRIFDDYGFSSLVLKYTVVSQGRPSEENVAIINFSDRIRTEGEIEFNWDMETFNLYPGDYVAYHFEVADNDMISGPKISSSRQYIARLPSLEELIAQTESESKQRIVDNEQLLKTGKDLAERLKNAARKLDAQRKESRKTDWKHQKELESITGKNIELVEKIDEMANRMDASLERMQENTLMSREILEKMNEIQKLFSEVATQEMREAQKRLMDALKEMDRQQVMEAMKEFQLSQEEMLKRLERTLALLKKMQLEQKMEAMIRQAEQLAERQEDMNQKADSSEKQTLPQMSRDEDEIRNSLNDLKEQVNELQELMKEAKMASSPEAQKFAEAVKKTDADKNMQQMSEEMKGQNRESAVKEGEQALSKLTEMVGSMQEQLMAMQGDDSDQIKKAMRRAIEDANYLSQNEEELLREAAAIDPRSLALHEVAKSQQDVTAACSGLKNTISELGKQSPFVAAELQMLVDNAERNMELAMQELENKRGTTARRYQREAMVGLNKASIRLMESLEQQKQCDNPKNCNKGMAQLESLCNKQNDLNQQTKSQCNNPKDGMGKPGQSERKMLQRLAGEQGSIRKSMEQLAQEFGNSRQILGRLDDIAKDMKDIEEGLASGEVGDEVTQRQLKVLSRMLEASRSLQRRDFSEQRKADVSMDKPLYIPPSLSADLLNDKIQLEDRLRQFLGTGYPAQYEEQIKAYFRALLKAQGQMNSVTPAGE